MRYPANMSDYGLCDDDEDTMTIWVRLNQSQPDLLETIIHEALHACMRDTTEEAVTETARDVAKLLWRFGYRLKNK